MGITYARGHSSKGMSKKELEGPGTQLKKLELNPIQGPREV